MPLKPGKDKKTVSSNIREFHTGKTYAHTKAKFGKADADKQAIAVALSTARKYAKKADGGADLDATIRKKIDPIKRAAAPDNRWKDLRRSQNIEDRRDEEASHWNDSLYWQPTTHFDEYYADPNEALQPYNALAGGLGVGELDLKALGYAEGGGTDPAVADWEGADEEAKQNLAAQGPIVEPKKSWVPTTGQLSKWWYGDQPEKSIENEADLTADPVSRAIAGVGHAVTAPGRAMRGEIPEEQMVPEALNMAGTMVGTTSMSPVQGGLGTGVGRLSVGKHLEKLPEFERLETKGVHPQDNFSTTGWYRGDDNMPRYWVDDAKAKLKTENIPMHQGKAYVPYDPAEGMPSKLGDIWDHPDLYKAHPWLKDVDIWPVPEKDTSLGRYDPVSKSIFVKDLPLNEFHDVLHHEVVHAIQHHEGFSNGGALEQFLPENFQQRTDAVNSKLNQIIQRVDERGVAPESIPWEELARIFTVKPEKLKPEDIMVRHDLNRAGVLPEVQKVIKEKEKLARQEAQAYEKYLHIAGESEARDAPYLRNNPGARMPWEVPKHFNPELRHTNLEVTEPFPKNVGIRGEDLDALPDGFVPDGVFESRGPQAAVAPKGYTKGMDEIMSLHDDIIEAALSPKPKAGLLKSYYPKDIAASAVELQFNPTEINLLKKQLTPGAIEAFDKHYAKIKKSYDEYMKANQPPAPPVAAPAEKPFKPHYPEIDAAEAALKALEKELGVPEKGVKPSNGGLKGAWQEVKKDIGATTSALKDAFGFKKPEPPAKPPELAPPPITVSSGPTPAPGYPKLSYHWTPDPPVDMHIRKLIQSNFEPVNWKTYTPKDYNATVKKKPDVQFNVPPEHIEGLGGNTKVPLWKGGDWADYPQELVDPTQKVVPNGGGPAKEKFEKGFFLADDPRIAEYYKKHPDGLHPYIAVPKNKVVQFDWTDLAKKFGITDEWMNTASYTPVLMKHAIDAAREAGVDMAIAHNIVDLGGNQTQYIVLNTNILRAPHAKFDPSKLHLRWPLAGIAGAGVYTYGAMSNEAKAEGKKGGGSVKKRHPQIDENPQDHEFIDFSRGGLIDSHIPGRTDKIPMRVRPGSYVLPADIPSALGEGNSKAGADILKKMFTHSAYGLPPPHIHSHEFRPPRMLKGKATGGKADHVPIVAAGGEFVIHPDVVHHLGQGSMTKGHKLLDHFVLHTRREHIKTLRKLKPPK